MLSTRKVRSIRLGIGITTSKTVEKLKIDVNYYQSVLRL